MKLKSPPVLFTTDADPLDGRDLTDLEKHDRKYHPRGYKDGDFCKYRQALERGDSADDLAAAEKEEDSQTSAMQKVIDRYNALAYLMMTAPAGDAPYVKALSEYGIGKGDKEFAPAMSAIESAQEWFDANDEGDDLVGYRMKVIELDDAINAIKKGGKAAAKSPSKGVKSEADMVREIADDPAGLPRSTDASMGRKLADGHAQEWRKVFAGVNAPEVPYMDLCMRTLEGEATGLSESQAIRGAVSMGWYPETNLYRGGGREISVDYITSSNKTIHLACQDMTMTPLRAALKSYDVLNNRGGDVFRGTDRPKAASPSGRPSKKGATAASAASADDILDLHDIRSDLERVARLLNGRAGNLAALQSSSRWSDLQHVAKSTKVGPRLDAIAKSPDPKTASAAAALRKVFDNIVKSSKNNWNDKAGMVLSESSLPPLPDDDDFSYNGSCGRC